MVNDLFCSVSFQDRHRTATMDTPGTGPASGREPGPRAGGSVPAGASVGVRRGAWVWRGSGFKLAGGRPTKLPAAAGARLAALTEADQARRRPGAATH